MLKEILFEKSIINCNPAAHIATIEEGIYKVKKDFKIAYGALQAKFLSGDIIRIMNTKLDNKSISKIYKYNSISKGWDLEVGNLHIFKLIDVCDEFLKPFVMCITYLGKTTQHKKVKMEMEKLNSSNEYVFISVKDAIKFLTDLKKAKKIKIQIVK